METEGFKEKGIRRERKGFSLGEGRSTGSTKQCGEGEKMEMNTSEMELREE